MKYINKDRTMLFLDSIGLSLCAFFNKEGPKGKLDFGPKKTGKKIFSKIKKEIEKDNK